MVGIDQAVSEETRNKNTFNKHAGLHKNSLIYSKAKPWLFFPNKNLSFVILFVYT